MDAFDRIAKRTPSRTRRMVSKMLDVADRIQAVLEQKGMSQKDLAVAMHKSESEISKWLSGTHNLELKTIVRIEEALGEDILAVPSNLEVNEK
jgi:transcriptional regulator with XRE-family HTH domain